MIDNIVKIIIYKDEKNKPYVTILIEPTWIRFVSLSEKVYTLIKFGVPKSINLSGNNTLRSIVLVSPDSSINI